MTKNDFVDEDSLETIHDIFNHEKPNNYFYDLLNSTDEIESKDESPTLDTEDHIKKSYSCF